MDSLIMILLVCVAVPLLLSTMLLEKKSRLIVLFIVIGAIVCVCVAKINGLILRVSGETMFTVCTTFSPISEEIIKAIPVLFFAFVVSDKRETLISVAMATGIGFAILENSYMLVSDVDNANILWAFTRVFGASLVHGICTSAVGLGISFVHKRKKLFFTGTFALLVAAMIYHGIYNALVMSTFKQIGFILPMITYIPIVIVFIKSRIKKNKKASAE